MLPFNHGRHPHITGRFALAFSQVPGTVVLDAEPYRLWLIPGGWRFLLLEQRDDNERATDRSSATGDPVGHGPRLVPSPK